MSKEMSFLEHLDELRRRIVRIAIAVGAITIFSFLFGFREFHFSQTAIWLPYFSPPPQDNLVQQLIKRVTSDQLPSFVKIIVTEPSQAILAQLYISVFIGLIAGMPVIVREITAFVGPGLYPHEKRMIGKIVIPASLLFIAGAVFSYYAVTPIAIQFLYLYAIGITSDLFITLESFISFVLLFTIAFGISFQLPIFMWLVTKAGVVDAGFWRRNLNIAIVAIVIFGAIITPDGSGITMWFVALPMMLLYAAGYWFLRRDARHHGKQVVT